MQLFETIGLEFIAPPNTEFYHGLGLEIHFTAPFPVQDQQWDMWPAQFVPPPPLPPPGSGRRYAPPTDYLPEPPWDERPRKPVRPIWDRPAPPAPTPVAPSGPPPLPPMSAFGPQPGAPLIVRSLPTFNEHVTPDLVALGDRLKAAMAQAKRDRDEEALALLLDALDNDEEE